MCVDAARKGMCAEGAQVWKGVAGRGVVGLDVWIVGQRRCFLKGCVKGYVVDSRVGDMERFESRERLSEYA